MAKNDVILIDSILQKNAANFLGNDLGENFEQFALEQILKDFDISSEELEFGWIDGSHDGGIDGFYVFINGRLLTDPHDYQWPRSGAEIEVFLITCKHHATFSQAPLDAILASIQEIFDLSKKNEELIGKYSEELISCREIFFSAFTNLSLSRPSLKFTVVYASRGDSKTLGESVSARGEQLTSLLNSYFSASSSEFKILGASELVELYREIKTFELDLPVQECLTAGEDGYVVLAQLRDYCSFVVDEKGLLRRYLFDSNVRAFLGENLVNTDISQTLSNASSPNFWWLNNGVTILATSASLVRKTLKLKDIQIVNGLQTTESIYRHFSIANNDGQDKRSLLVKVIVSQDSRIRDQVIRATNNQSAVEPSALHATDKIQRDIEEILIRHDWFYERRTNYFTNEGRPEARIIYPITIARGSVALLIKDPIKSSKLRQKHIRREEAYKAVYSEHFPVDVWPIVAALIRGSENIIIKSSVGKKGARGRLVSAWSGFLAYIAVVRLFKSFSYTLKDLASIDVSKITDEYINNCWIAIAQSAEIIGSEKLKEEKAEQLFLALAKKWDISGNPQDGKRIIPAPVFAPNSAYVVPDDEDFIEKVSNALPVQPWKPGIHEAIATQLGVNKKRVSNAINCLINRGIWLHQLDGIVYDLNGKEVMRDEIRAPF